ncbi:uncharacterized protein LOC122572376 [Bombus pyrosoma]|uniref:uncharacterized protein LOC122572376 n=1 Tax=Bombus pyrosoma TaxID=396416 RepID=UPI001CB8C9C8|nr:uncharacterized protein LOC122572376 [Bombus pyrosoma]
MATPTPYLHAIQAVPGDTPGEKFRWIAKFIQQRLSVSNDLEDLESEEIPKPLVPLVQVQAAIMLNKADPKNQSTYEAIAEALKSEDELVVNEALKAKNFFNGTNEAITNNKYFFENLFPYVSLNTRVRIIKTLALRLAPRNSELAEEFFLSIDSFYGLEQALPLLLACSESFVYNTIIEKRIGLSRRMVKLFFRKNPNFVVRYLRLSKPTTSSCARKLPSVNIHEFTDILAALVKIQLNSFAELYEMHEENPPILFLSNKGVEAFLKNGREYLERKTKLYIDILPLKSISNCYMEAIFPKLFPDNIRDVDTDEMLKYLRYYRQDKKVDLFLRSYQKVYNKNILNDPGKITANLLEILHPEERIKQAKIKLNSKTAALTKSENIVTWECFLGIKESLPLFEEEMCKATEMEHRARIACKMIHSCKINNDISALLKVLMFLNSKHYNERSWFLYEVFNTLLKLYDLAQLGTDYWKILTDMMKRAHVTKDLFALNNVSVRMVEAAINYKINQNEPFPELIDMLIDIKTTKCKGYWNILQNNYNFERMCLENCLNIVSQKYNSDQAPWKEDKVGILFDICSSIYYFNQVHVSKNSHVERMTVKNYPWLLQAIEEILSTTTQNDIYIVLSLQNIFMRYEMELYERFWPRTEKMVEIKISKAVRLLKRNPQDILDHWKEYLKVCKDNWKKGHGKLFIKAIRWYKEIPIKFAEQCLQDLTEKEEEICLCILSTLVYGKTFSKIIEPLIPTNRTLDIHQRDAKTSYNLIQHLISGIKVANPPVPLTVLNKFCQGDYLPVVLTALINVCRRTNIMDVMSFAKMLSSQRVAVRKHGIRLMRIVASRDQLLNFFREQWKTEENQSIREVMLIIIIKLFQEEPEVSTRLLLSHMISTLTLQNERCCHLVLSVINSVPDQYVVDFIKQTLNMIDMFERLGLHKDKVAVYTSILLRYIDEPICNLLPESFIKSLIQRYLFHRHPDVAKSLNEFVVTVLLLPAESEFDNRLKIFSSLFRETVVRGWDIPTSKNPSFVPTNNALRKFIDVITHTVSYSSKKLRLIDEILSMFITSLHPLLDPTSYLLLTFSKMQVISRTPAEFGFNVSQRLNDLIKIFSPYFIFFMTDILRNMPLSNTFKHYDKIDIDLGIIEGLLEIYTTTSALMAVQLLHSITSNEQQERRNRVLVTLMKCKFPAIKAMACEIINEKYSTV